MKVQIKSNSLAFIVTRTDADRLFKEGYLEEQLNFPRDPLLYALQLSTGQELTSSFIDNKITMCISRKMLTELLDTSRTRFENRVGGLSLLIEKDFSR